MTYIEMINTLEAMEAKMKSLFSDIYNLRYFITPNITYVRQCRDYTQRPEGIKREDYKKYLVSYTSIHKDNLSPELLAVSYEDTLNLKVNNTADIKVYHEYMYIHDSQCKLDEEYGANTKYNIFQAFLELQDRKTLSQTPYNSTVDALVNIFGSSYSDFYHSYYDILASDGIGRKLNSSEVQMLNRVFNIPAFQNNADVLQELANAFMQFISAELLNYIPSGRALTILNDTFLSIKKESIYDIGYQNLWDISHILEYDLLEFISKLTDFTNHSYWPLKRNLPYLLQDALHNVNITSNIYEKTKLLGVDSYNGRSINKWIALLAIKTIAEDIITYQNRFKLEV